MSLEPAPKSWQGVTRRDAWSPRLALGSGCVRSRIPFPRCPAAFPAHASCAEPCHCCFGFPVGAQRVQPPGAEASPHPRAPRAPPCSRPAPEPHSGQACAELCLCAPAEPGPSLGRTPACPASLSAASVCPCLAVHAAHSLSTQRLRSCGRVRPAGWRRSPGAWSPSLFPAAPTRPLASRSCDVARSLSSLPSPASWLGEHQDSSPQGLLRRCPCPSLPAPMGLPSDSGGAVRLPLLLRGSRGALCPSYGCLIFPPRLCLLLC